jgi:hypothetical protein
VFANAKPHASVPWRDGRYTYRWRNRLGSFYEFKHQIGDLEACKLLENGTDERYVEALAKAAVDCGESAA